jgi:hypothetical protein
MRALGYFLQVTGLVVTLGAFLFFGFKPTMGPMLYTALAGAAAFYGGTVLMRRGA